VQLDSFRELYASKTDGELLSLAAEKNSLIAIARLAVADELRRRNLADLPVPEPISTLPAEAESQPDRKTANPSRLLWLGLFLLDTFLVYQCAWRVPPVLVRMWFAWFAPIFGTPSNVAPLDWHLRHLVLMTIIISLIAGYIDVARFLPAIVGKQIAGRRSSSAAAWMWIIPTTVLLYGTLQFRASSVHDPSASAFKYFFDFSAAVHAYVGNPAARDFWARVRVQRQVTAPFYAGIAYSCGALAWKHRLLPTLFRFEEHDEPATLQEQ
jgi:hypothetical protein